jgi:hypothetical protein
MKLVLFSIARNGDVRPGPDETNERFRVERAAGFSGTIGLFAQAVPVAKASRRSELKITANLLWHI